MRLDRGGGGLVVWGWFNCCSSFPLTSFRPSVGGASPVGMMEDATCSGLGLLPAAEFYFLRQQIYETDEERREGSLAKRACRLASPCTFPARPGGEHNLLRAHTLAYFSACLADGDLEKLSVGDVYAVIAPESFLESLSVAQKKKADFIS